MAHHALTKKLSTNVLATLAGIGFLAMALFLPAQQLIFKQSDATAVAEVIDSRESCRRGTCNYHPVVRFDTEEGQRVVAEARYSSTDEAPTVGSTVQVNYQAADPTQVQVAGRQTSNYLIAAGCLAIGLLLLIVYGRNLRRVLAERR